MELRRTFAIPLYFVAVAPSYFFSDCSAFQLSTLPVSTRADLGVPTCRRGVSNLQRARMTPEAFQAASDVLAGNAFHGVDLPFGELGKQLSQSLDIGEGLFNNVGKVPEKETSVVLESIGNDLLVFLIASVIVVPLSKALNVTPILGYLVIGAILGENGLDVFANSAASVEFGDFGILFLLFSEGLEVTTSRLKKLANYLPLGFAQITLVTGVITATFLLGAPHALGQYLALDPSVVGINRPVEAVVLALAACLSTSAFIFPVLKERGWEDEESGEAATSILLLQDLMVAPLLVILPFLVGSGTDYAAIGFLTAKATIGFGSVLVFGSFVLQGIFALVAQTESAETFVALCLLVSAGMGAVAKTLGLTDTAGAFAAGVLLANTNYRAQIQADILPFKGILLGIFFMTAGSNFDINLVMSQFPTILVGSISLVVVKAITLWMATRVPEWMEPNRLQAADALRVSLLLSGGGEFAFVVLALAEKLGIIPTDLASVTTAIILITMGITPLLGEVAEIMSEPLIALKDATPTVGTEQPLVASRPVVICGYGEVGRSLLRVLGNERDLIRQFSNTTTQAPTIVAFDTIPSLLDEILMPGNKTMVLYGNGANAEVIRSYGITDPLAIFVAYTEYGRALDATARLRTSFSGTPIYTRAATQREARQLRRAGATQAVVEADELPRFAPQLMQGVWTGSLESEAYEDPERLRVAAHDASGLSYSKIDKLLEIYKGMDQDGSGFVNINEIEEILDKSGSWIASDEEVKKLNDWLEKSDSNYLTAIEFCCLYANAPKYVQKSFGLSSRQASRPSSSI